MCTSQKEELGAALKDLTGVCETSFLFYSSMMFMALFDGRNFVQSKPCLLELICAHTYTIRSLRSPR